MKVLAVLWAVELCLVSSVGHAQGTADITSFAGNAEVTFNKLANETSLIILCPIDPASISTGLQVSLEKQHQLIDSVIEGTKLVQDQRSGYDYGSWKGKNATGYVSLSISCTNPFKQHVFSVLYMPPAQQRIPDPILSNLLSKSSGQKLNSVDEIQLDFPNPRIGQSKCTSSRTIWISITTGAMTSTDFEVRCAY
jgi:hypothetical protein